MGRPQRVEIQVYPSELKGPGLIDSDDRLEFMVYNGRCVLGPGVNGAGLADDSGGGLFLLRVG
jgi:hypothetical protein